MYVDKRVVSMEVPEKIRRGIPTPMWLDNIRNDLLEREQSGLEKWRRRIRKVDQIS